MAHVILPNSTAAMPKTNAERTPLPSAQPALYGLMPGEEMEDEPGEEMAKDARVWKTYVRETDTWDKEMVGGRNSSLDVLLIFAALFSAISTAFITASLGDLKPDPADTAVQMQRAMLETQQALLQAVAAIANGQSFTMPPARPDPVSTPPTQSAVAVNVLWLLSLALSVGVSLVAMLAKDWCYKFMSGRNGPLYEQGRRRQQRWDGIERWKMQELLACLPGAMHLALLLFAIGLCIYLWDIHVAVAVPVTFVTGVVMCGYLAASVLPLLQWYCPYSTPVTPVLQWLMTHPVLQMIEYVLLRSTGSEEIRSASSWSRLCTWITTHCPAGSDRTAPDNHEVHMDDTTARMLVWLITTCDDIRSIDVALQAIAGASPRLPCSALFRCRAHEQLFSRIMIYHKQGHNSGELAASSASAALCIIRAYAALFTDDLKSYLVTTEAQVQKLRESLQQQQQRDAMLVHFAICSRLLETKGNDDKAVLLTAASSSIMLSRVMRLGLEPATLSQLTQYYFTTKLFIPALQNYSLRKSALDVVTVRYVLRSLSERLAEHERRTLGALCGALALLWVVPDRTAPDLPRMASTMLAAIAFTLRSYPGGEQPAVDNQLARSKRALQVFEYYQSHEPDDRVAAGLFAFGFVAVLPELKRGAFDGCDDTGQVLRSLFRGLLLLGEQVTVHSLPDGCSLDGHLGWPAEVVQWDTVSDEPAATGTWSYILRNKCELDLSDPQLYGAALEALCHTHSVELQELCENILDSQVLTKVVQKDFDLAYWISRAARGLQTRGTNAAVSPAIILYVRLVAAYMMLTPTAWSSQHEQWETQWSRSWECGSLLGYIEPEGNISSSDDILDHLAQDTDQMNPIPSMQTTAQLFLNVCCFSSLGVTPEPVYANWEARLHEIRCSRRPAARAVNWGGGPAAAGAASYKPSGAGAAHDGGVGADHLAGQDEGKKEPTVKEMLLTGDGTAWN